VLSKRLSTMVDSGLLRRVPYQDRRRTRHEAGADTFPIITALAHWGERHRPHADSGIRRDIVHRSCGHPSTTADFRSHCGQRLTLEARHGESPDATRKTSS